MAEKILAIDFDGTIVEKLEPFIPTKYGNLLDGCKEALLKLKSHGYDLQIFTARSNILPVKECLEKNEIPYNDINSSLRFDEPTKNTTPKLHAHYYIDDRALRFDRNWEAVVDFILENEDTSEKEILYKSKWHTIIRRDGFDYREGIVGGVILPFRIRDTKKEYLLRKEPKPPEKEESVTLITGRFEEDENPRKGIIRELKEESGYAIDTFKLEFFGKVYIGKDCITPEYVFSADLTDIPQEKITTDGTEDEKNSFNFWVSEPELLEWASSTEDIYLPAVVFKVLHTSKKPAGDISKIEEFLKSDFICKLLKDINYANIFDFVSFDICEPLAYYDAVRKQVIFDYDAFNTLLDGDNLKLYKVLVHELTHLVDDFSGNLVIPKEDIVLNYFENPSEVKAVNNEIKFFKNQGLEENEIQKIFNKSFSRFGSMYTEDLKRQLTERIQNN